MRDIIVQIYEIQTPWEAEKLIELGVDHIGSVVVSEVMLKQPEIRETIRTVKNAGTRSSLILLFNTLDSVSEALDFYRPDIVHFCETLTFSVGDAAGCDALIALQGRVKEKFPEIKIMRSIPIPPPGRTELLSAIETARLFEAVSDYFLTDTILGKAATVSADHQPVKGFVGLTGQACNWEIAGELVASSRIPVILAGGISPANVGDGILQVRPAGVDSCTRTNAVDEWGNPRRFKKDLGKVKRFVDEARRAARRL